jgi:anti-anti-sigma factor
VTATPLAWRVDAAAERTIVAVWGALDLHATSRLRIALLKCLAEQPAALLIDLRAVQLGDESALAVFTVVSRQASQWPGIPVVLCGPAEQIRRPLERGRFGRLTVQPSLDAAVRALEGARMATRTLREQLMPVPGAALEARNLVTAACTGWDLPELVGPASLVVSELVSNAVEHAGTAMTLEVSCHDRYLRVAVRDGSPVQPRMRPPEAPSSTVRGRGLMLVDNFATHWGSLPTADGKVIWATLSVS